jgi:hypothetical protein
VSKKGKSKKRKVNNQEDSKANVKNPNEPNREEEGLKFDFSFEALYYSVKLSKGKFNNYLRGESEFIDKFRQIRNINAKLKNKKFGEVRNDPRAHFHEVSGEERKTVTNCVAHALSNFGESSNVSNFIEQLLGNETIYQIGLEKGVRVIGTYNEGTFRVYLIDYHHRLYYDQRRNTHGEKELNFCPMKSDIT